LGRQTWTILSSDGSFGTLKFQKQALRGKLTWLTWHVSFLIPGIPVSQRKYAKIPELQPWH